VIQKHEKYKATHTILTHDRPTMQARRMS